MTTQITERLETIATSLNEADRSAGDYNHFEHFCQLAFEQGLEVDHEHQQDEDETAAYTLFAVEGSLHYSDSWKVDYDSIIGFQIETNCDIYDHSGMYVGRIDSDGDISIDAELDLNKADEEKLQDAIRTYLARQFVGREDYGWPLVSEWPEEVIIAIRHEISDDEKRRALKSDEAVYDQPFRREALAAALGVGN